VSDYLPWLLGIDLDGHEKIVKKANATLDRLHDAVIGPRWGQWKSGEREEVEDLLDVLITHVDRDGNPLLTIEEVKAQSKVMIEMLIHDDESSTMYISVATGFTS
jgi:tyrosine N-monooxygenase